MTMGAAIELRPLSCKDRDCFFNDLYSWDHSSLLTVSKEQLLKWVSAHSRGSFFRFDIYNTLCLLMFLFQDPLELISKIRTDQPLIERHVCSKCKTIYHVTPLANKLGWGCPACEKGKTLAERDQMAATILLNKRQIKQEQKEEKKSKRAQKEELRKRRKELKAEEKRRKLQQREEEKTMKREQRAAKKKRKQEEKEYSTRLRRQVRNLVGDEYEVLSFKKHDESTELTLCHNSCGNTFKSSRIAFLAGARCPQCTVFHSNSVIRKTLEDASGGKYAFTEDGSGHDYIVLNKETNEKIEITRRTIIQELSRPTPSNIFSGIKTGYRFPDWQDCLNMYLEYVSEHGEPPTRRTEYKGLMLGIWCASLKLKKSLGLVSDERIRYMANAGFDWG